MEIKIQIINTSLEDLGVDQEPSYVPFHFKEESFHGYWVDEDVINFYVGASIFICKNTQKNQLLLESLL